MPLRRVGDFGVTGLEAVEMKLHAGRSAYARAFPLALNQRSSWPDLIRPSMRLVNKSNLTAECAALGGLFHLPPRLAASFRGKRPQRGNAPQHGNLYPTLQSIHSAILDFVSASSERRFENQQTHAPTGGIGRCRAGHRYSRLPVGMGRGHL